MPLVVCNVYLAVAGSLVFSTAVHSLRAHLPDELSSRTPGDDDAHDASAVRQPIGSRTTRQAQHTLNDIDGPVWPSTGAHSVHYVTPYVIDDSFVMGPAALTALPVAPAETEEHLDSGGVRALLHGRRRPARYAVCNRCTIIRCTGRNCNGHCRRGRRVFDCSTRNQPPRERCARPRRRGGFNPVVSPLMPPASLVVTATAPFIGCAHIADRPADAACPAAGTRGVMPATGNSDAVQYEVESSSCTRTEYTPECTNRPYYPVGVCLCSKVSLSGESMGLHACDARELELPSAGSATEPDEVRVVIEDRGTTVYTGIFDYTEPEDRPADEAQVQIRGIETDPDAEITVLIEVYRGFEAGGSEVGEEDGMVSGDYYDADYIESDCSARVGDPFVGDSFEYGDYTYITPSAYGLCFSVDENGCRVSSSDCLYDYL